MLALSLANRSLPPPAPACAQRGPAYHRSGQQRAPAAVLHGRGAGALPVLLCARAVQVCPCAAAGSLWAWAVCRSGCSQHLRLIREAVGFERWGGCGAPSLPLSEPWLCSLALPSLLHAAARPLKRAWPRRHPPSRPASTRPGPTGYLRPIHPPRPCAQRCPPWPNDVRSQLLPPRASGPLVCTLTKCGLHPHPQP